MPSDVVGDALTARQQRALREWQTRPVRHFGTCCACHRDHDETGRPLYVAGHRRSHMRCRRCILEAATTAADRRDQLVLL